MITCPKCGTKNNDNFNCCYNCGTSLTDDIGDDEIIAPAETEAYDEAEDIFNRKSREDADSKSDLSLTKASKHSNDDKQDDDVFNSVYSSSAYRNQHTTVNTSKKKVSSYKTTEPETAKRSDIRVNKMAILLLFLVVMVLVVWGTVSLLNKWFGGPISEATPTPQTTVTPAPTPTALPSGLVVSDFSYTPEYNSETKDKTFDISILTNGTKLFIMGKEYEVNDGVLSIKLSEFEIYSYCKPSHAMQKDESFTAKFNIIIQKDGFNNAVYEAQIENVQMPLVPFELLTPTELTATVYKTATEVSFKTLPGSRVRIYINDTDVTDTDFDKTTGIFKRVIQTPISNERYRYMIELESEEYQTRTIILDLARSADHDPNAEIKLELERYFFEATTDGLITVKGTYTGPKDDLRFVSKNTNASRLSLVSINFSNDGEGHFEAVLKSEFHGTMEVVAECMADYGVNDTFYIRNLTLGDITTKAQGVKGLYNVLFDKATDGSTYVLGFNTYGEDKATVKEIIETKSGKALIVNITPSAENETLVYVEIFSDAFTKKVGDRVKIFVTKSGLYNDEMPKFLANIIY